MSLKNLNVVGFDLDHTLYPQTEESQKKIREKIYEKLATAMNIPFATAGELFEQEYASNNHWGKSGSRTIIELCASAGLDLDGKLIVQQAIEDADILEFIEPNPKLNEMLIKLKNRYWLDLITGTSQKLAYSKLERLEINQKVFGFMLMGGEYGSKTTGEVYQRWIELRSVPVPSMLYVGDNTKQDIDSPKALGIKTCIVGKEYDKADYHISNILELEGLLD